VSCFGSGVEFAFGALATGAFSATGVLAVFVTTGLLVLVLDLELVFAVTLADFAVANVFLPMLTTSILQDSRGALRGIA
jgi:hypothetical protein